MDYIERYAKEKNLLQLPIFSFSKLRPVPEKISVSWKSGKADCKLECVCKFGVPGAFEQDVHTACMRIWIEDGMPKGGIEISYAQIARKLNLSPPRAWAGKIKKALERLSMARYEVIKCFIKAKDGLDEAVYFSLFSSTHLFDGTTKDANKRTGKSQLYFPDEIRENLEAKYYQFLDMAWYKALPSGLPRRLYEYLAKRRYHGAKDGLKIGEEIVCRWLPIQDKNTTTRRKTLQDSADSLIKAGYLESYSFDADKRQCVFTYSKSLPPVEVEAEEIVANMIEVSNEPGQVLGQEDFDQDHEAFDPDTEDFDQGHEAFDPDTGAFDQNNETFEQEVIQAPIQVQQTIEYQSQQTKPSNAQASQESSQADFVDAILWLKSIPYMREPIIKKLTADPEFLAKYPAVRLEYERQTEKIESPAAWVQSAFKTGYVHIKTKQDFEREELEKKKKEKARLQNIENETRQAIQKCGGPGKAMYCGHVIEFVFDGGIGFKNSGMVWKDIDPSKISAS